ncbi:MAG: hypothetical protein Pg6C_16550 [Treponemataceae bacterium]|nr:MAG: hypothetical protein Pg6C_16550 [Treponemataceae bacterium]
MDKVLKRIVVTALFACLSAAVFVSCTDFFTNSWAENAKRDYSQIKVDASNVDSLLKAARGDPEMALVILDKIKGAMNGASAADKAKLREAALKAAAQGTNVSGLIVENISELTKTLSGGTDEDKVKELLEKISDSASGMARASGDLAAILPAVGGDGKFTEGFTASEDELMQTAVIIILGKAGSAPDEYLNSFLGRNFDTTAGLDNEEKALMAIINKMQDDFPNGTLAGMVKPR